MRDLFLHILVIIGIVLIIVAIVALIVIEIYCWTNYGGKPVSEVPLWVLWFLWG